MIHIPIFLELNILSKTKTTYYFSCFVHPLNKGLKTDYIKYYFIFNKIIQQTNKMYNI